MNPIRATFAYFGHEYFYHDFWEENSDPRTKDFPIVYGGPWTLLSIIAFYLLFVQYLGPAIMKNRKGFELRGPIFLYNLIMIAINGWIFVKAFILLRYGYDTWGCQPNDPGVGNPEATTPKAWELVIVAYVFFLTKIIELLDTVFFVLRKKYNQVSRLHVIHHSSVPVVCWIAAKVFSTYASTSVGLFPLINSGIHTIMYSYYALAALGPKVQKYLWWKKYLTQMQLSQFVLILIHSSHFMFLRNCEYPRIFTYLGIFNAVLFFCLFAHFYVRSYLKYKHRNDDKPHNNGYKNGHINGHNNGHCNGMTNGNHRYTSGSSKKIE